MIVKYDVTVLNSNKFIWPDYSFMQILHSGEWSLNIDDDSSLSNRMNLKPSPDCVVTYNNDLSEIPRFIDYTSACDDSSDPGVVILVANQPTQNYITNATRLGIADVIDIDQTTEQELKQSILNVCHKRRLWKKIISH